jgi:spermidine synthase
VEYVEVARAESERGEVVLRERVDPDAVGAPSVLELRVNGVFVMDTAETGSERALAAAALAQVERPASVLIGGLGLGYTMHEVLADRRVERLVVVEIEEAVIGWMRDGTVPHGPAFLADDRLEIVQADVRTAVAEATGTTYDLILLDVDNGPDALVHAVNAAVYEHAFLSAARGRLRPGGALAVWSAAQSARLQERMRAALGNVVAVPYDVALQGRAEQYWLYLSRRAPRS